MYEERILSVSQLTEMIRLSLEGSFRSIHLEGELSNCRPSSTGHLYFTLKDAGASISAVMFKNRLKSLSFEPRDGMLLQARGSVSVYAQRGSYQIICEELELAGTGDILAALEQRKQRLAAEGLFSEERKRPLSRFPRRIGIVSSPTGAAVRDILNVLRRRAPGLDMVILPAPVQGAEAAQIIAQRIEQANHWDLADTLIIGRGGGSLEDLLPFSDELVVRAVASSRIPTISAVGHEIDWALSDFAADLRAPTPSAAAELASADWRETALILQSQRTELENNMKGRLERVKLLLKPFHLDDLEFRFRGILQPRLVRFDDAKEELLASLRDRLRDLRGKLNATTAALEAASPAAILERGFSVIKSGEKVIRRADEVAIGEKLSLILMEGSLEARVELIHKQENEGNG